MAETVFPEGFAVSDRLQPLAFGLTLGATGSASMSTFAYTPDLALV